MKRAMICVAMMSFVPPALAQGYGIRTMPAPRVQPIPKERPGYRGAYDRADDAWRAERHDCLYGRASSSTTQRACSDTLRNRQPLPSDFIKAPAAK
ncbi:MAG: hypothetical protein E7773_14390 [Sphingomonas sp.]|uniref:hypothetical protein n=1 Tax=Sphingomonas sp. TaxID=28214 RepID=UPI001201F783|nr:hypothetical protein [Sphingomonas sp.]THD34841.1 MAG: hypothetical protein E7773_14390 [Sphingomonas sp.]